MSDSERNVAAQHALELFKQSHLFSVQQHFGCYLARMEEFDCSPIIQSIWQAGKNCYLPTLSKEKEGYLDFMAYRHDDGLQLNRFRILEPDHGEIFPAEQLDVVLLPLVGFDSKGNRLGVGGGYYDRTFEFTRKHDKKSPLLIGLAYEFQHVHHLPFDEWDVPLNGVLTEERIILF
jgi:5-formyltetrahydrofolate cyclo-ligase